MHHLLEPNDSALADWLAEHNLPGYRAKQIRRWLWQRRAGSIDDMTDLPKGLRTKLAEAFSIWTTTIAKHTVAEDGTEKLLVEMHDGHRVECVLLRDGPRRSICISTQVGCGMGCVFCASGLDGVERNLTSGEIIEQILLLDRLLDDDERLSHIVVMGMGEPLANLDNLLPALDAASSPDGLGISPRRITVSTVGLPKSIRRLAEIKARYNLAVSIHAADDPLRRRLIPAAKNISLAEVLEAADLYFESSGRRLTFEYVLLARENDRAEHAQALGRLLCDKTAMINLIPYNPVDGLPYQTPSPEAVREFRETLERFGCNVNVRFRKGDKIDAACGQLRRSMPTTSPQSLSGHSDEVVVVSPNLNLGRPEKTETQD